MAFGNLFGDVVKKYGPAGDESGHSDHGVISVDRGEQGIPIQRLHT